MKEVRIAMLKTTKKLSVVKFDRQTTESPDPIAIKLKVESC